MQWRFLDVTRPQSADDVERILLKNRQVDDPGVFFNPPDPTGLSLASVGLQAPVVRKATKRLLAAIEKKQRVLVFGDYDADGICATAILWEALHSLGAEVLPFIPHREKHGYGLTWAALEELKQHPLPDLLITVDTGITALDAVKKLTKAGVEVIITDHHQPESELPPAAVVVHTPEISGAGVAWFLARELSTAAAGRSLELAALATVSDLMPLRGANRSLVFHGLRKLNATDRPGLKALFELAGLRNKPIDAGTIGYVLAPRINAMGRLSHGLDALRLLCTTDARRAKQLATVVQDTNADRQQLTDDLIQLARAQVHTQRQESLLIVHSPEFHEGVIGLIAGKLTEWYAKPTIVISTRGEIAKGSARSVPGVNITELIRSGREYLLEVGGHPMAAGFGLEPAQLNALITHLMAVAQERIDPELLQKTLDIECELPLELAQETAVMMKRFAPFGQGNPQPIFAFKKVQLTALQTVGNQGQHLKLTITNERSHKPLSVLAWGKGEAADQLSVGEIINLAGILEINTWRDTETTQIILKDLQAIEESS